MRYIYIFIVCLFLCSCNQNIPYINRSEKTPMFIITKVPPYRDDQYCYDISDGSFKWQLLTKELYDIGDEVTIVVTKRKR